MAFRPLPPVTRVVYLPDGKTGWSISPGGTSWARNRGTLNPGEKESGILRNHVLFDENLAIGAPTAGICEGQFNAIRAADALGLPFVAPLGKASEEQLDKLLALGAKGFIVAYDYGAERQAFGRGNALIKNSFSSRPSTRCKNPKSRRRSQLHPRPR